MHPAKVPQNQPLRPAVGASVLAHSFDNPAALTFRSSVDPLRSSSATSRNPRVLRLGAYAIAEGMCRLRAVTEPPHSDALSALEVPPGAHGTETCALWLMPRQIAAAVEKASCREALHRPASLGARDQPRPVKSMHSSGPTNNQVA